MANCESCIWILQIEWKLKFVFVTVLKRFPQLNAREGFPIMKRIKSAQRSCMEQDTLKCLMRINMFGPSVENYDPSRDIEHWLTTGGTKHVKGHKISPALSLPRKIRNRELESEDK